MAYTIPSRKKAGMGVDNSSGSVYHSQRMEWWPSGLRRAPAKRVGGNSRVGSNPTRSAKEKRVSHVSLFVFRENLDLRKVSRV